MYFQKVAMILMCGEKEVAHVCRVLSYKAKAAAVPKRRQLLKTCFTISTSTHTCPPSPTHTLFFLLKGERKERGG